MPDVLYRKDGNKFDDDSAKLVKSLTLKEYDKFLRSYNDKLNYFGDEKANDLWNLNTCPIQLQTGAEEDLEVDDLMVSGSVTFNKITATLCDLCLQMHHLTTYCHHSLLDPIIFYGEADEGKDEQMEISRFLTVLKEVHGFVEASAAVLRNLVQQLSIIHSNENSPVKSFEFSTSKFTVVYEKAGGLLASLAFLDHVVANQTCLKEHWKMYKRMLKNIRTSPETFGMGAEEVVAYVAKVEALEALVMASRMLQAVLTETYDDDHAGVYVSRNNHLEKAFLTATRASFASFEASVAGMSELEGKLGDGLVAVVCLCIFHQSLFQQASFDRKFFKNLWDTHKRFPGVLVAGLVTLYPTDLLSLHLPHIITPLVTVKGFQAVEAHRLSWIQKNISSLPGWTGGMEDSVTAWCLQMDSGSSSFSSVAINFTRVDLKLRTVLQGLSMVSKLRNHVCLLLNMHAGTKTPLNKASVLLLCRLVELIKVIAACFFRNSIRLHSLMHVSTHTTSLHLSRLLSTLHEKHRAGSKKTNKQTTVSLQLFTQALNGPVSHKRLLLMKLTIDALVKEKALKWDEALKMEEGIARLEGINNFSENLKESSDCGFLVFNRVLLSTYLSSLLHSPLHSFRLQYFLTALADVSSRLSNSRHSQDASKVVEDFEAFASQQVNEIFLDGVCRLVETELRLDSHHHLQLSSRNPFETQDSRRLDLFLQGPPLRLFRTFVSVKRYVEAYLNRTFYNLTTVALHDWKTYAEMRVMASSKFRLCLIDPHLPSQTLEQGLDILEIMRNIHVFVSKYLYNLNNQIFVERSSNNKHLNTITISHVANSIRTHGTGITNTTVNFTYQFLKKKFFVFSQFLYDEHIKSKLIKDVRFFKENQESLNFKYRYERAERFNKGIRKLGVDAEGHSYLDQFRSLISHIGNAMGYIRLIRSGGQHCCGNSIRFLSNVDEEGDKFEGMCMKDGLSDECLKAARHLDGVIDNLSRNFAEGTDYFKVLVDVFATEFRDPKNLHLKNFYAILPPLTLNYVEYIITSKEKLNKKNKDNAAFTDDGFAMGVAYILKLLNQHQNFDALHWFQSVKDKLLIQRAEISKQSNKEDEKLMQTMALTLKKVQVLQQEFNLLYFSLSSARIFFRATQEDKESTTESIKEEGLSTSTET